MEKSRQEKKSSIFSLLASYRGLILLLILFALLSNGINLLLPKIIAHGIDSYTNGTFKIEPVLIQFSVAILLVFVFTEYYSNVCFRKSGQRPQVKAFRPNFQAKPCVCNSS